MERQETLLRLQREFSDSAPNVRIICELFITLGYYDEIRTCRSMDDLKNLWLRLRSI